MNSRGFASFAIGVFEKEEVTATVMVVVVVVVTRIVGEIWTGTEY